MCVEVERAPGRVKNFLKMVGEGGLAVANTKMFYKIRDCYNGV